MALLISLWALPNFAQAQTLVPVSQAWKYLDNGSNQGTAWRAPSFADEGWASGNAELGYGDGDEAKVIGFGPDTNNKYITTYFRKSFTVAAPESWLSLSLAVLRDDGAVVYLNGVEVFRDNMPTGTISYNTLASSSIEDSTYHTTNTVAPALLVEGTNVLSVEVHQGAVNSSDLSFNLGLTGTLKPISIAALQPVSGATGVALAPTLSVRTTSAFAGNVSVSFYGRLVGAGGFGLLQTNSPVASGAMSSFTWAGLTPHTNYEWYAVTTQAANTTQTTVSQFATLNSIPIVTPQILSADEDTSVPITLAGSDADGDSLTFSVVTPPAHGTLSGTAPNLVYTPAADYAGNDSFTFRANDGFDNSEPNAISLTVLPISDAPVGLAQNVATIQDTSVSFAAAMDADGDALTFTYVTTPAHGSLVQSGVNLTYTPTASYQGADSFSFTVSDGTFASQEVTINILVLPPNEPPVAGNQSVTTNEDAPLGITISATDVDNNTLKYSVVTGPAHGTLSGSGPNLTYTPTANYNGPDSFTFRANDGFVNSNVATISLTVLAVNDAPSATSQGITLDKNTAVTITLTGADLEGDSLTYATVSQPAHGALLGTAPNLIYVPATDYLGADSFTFTANDGQATSVAGTVSLNVQVVTGTAISRGPYLQSPAQDRITLRWRTSTPVVGVVRFGVTSNGLSALVAETVSSTEHTVVLMGLSADTKYFYSIGTALDTIASGTDYFFRTHPTPGTNKPTRIWATGDFGTADANQTAVRNAFQTFQGGQPLDVWIMLGDNAYDNGTDSEYQSAVFNMYPTMLRNTPVWATYGNHEQGSLSDAAAGTAPFYSIFNFPTAGESGGVASGTESYYSFNYGRIHFVCMDSQATNRASNGAMAQWLEQDLSANTQEWVIAFFHHPIYSATTSHHTDVETRSIQMRQVFVPILENYGVDLVLSGHSHVYERSKLMDGHYGMSATLNTATMVKDAGDGDPTGNGAYVKDDAGRQGAVYTVAGNGGRSLDVIPTVHPVMVRSIVEYGSVIIDLDDHTLTSKMMDKNGQVRDTFQIVHNSRPVASPQLLTLMEDTSLAIALAGSDADGDALVSSILTQPAHGRVTGSAPNIVYTPTANYYGPDSFTFKVNDGKRDSLAATVSLTVTPVDDPVAVLVEQPTGTGLAYEGSTVAYGAVTAANPLTKTFTVRNASPDHDLTGVAISLTGGNAGDFSIVTPPASTMAASSSASFGVRFTPQATGARSTTLSIVSSDPAKSPWLIFLTGTGNTAPLFPGYTLSLKSGQSTNVSLSKILSKASDPDGDALAVTSVGASQIGGSVSLGASSLSYTAPATAAVDVVPITITDARGGAVSANLTVSIVADTALSKNAGLMTLHGNTLDVVFYGIPSRSYRVQHSSDLTNWTTKATVVADNLGRILWTDPGPLTTPGFYRTVAAQ